MKGAAASLNIYVYILNMIPHFAKASEITENKTLNTSGAE